MFKRIFWVGVGVAIGIVAVTKAQPMVEPIRLMRHASSCLAPIRTMCR